MKTYGRMATFTELSVNVFLRNGVQLNDLIMSGVLARYPKIKFVSVESGIGWIPFVLEALDYQFKDNRVPQERPEFTMLPSEYFARNVYACYWFEQTAPRRLIDKVGMDNILFETDSRTRPRFLVKRCTSGSKADSQIALRKYARRSYGERTEALQGCPAHCRR